MTRKSNWYIVAWVEKTQALDKKSEPEFKSDYCAFEDKQEALRFYDDCVKENAHSVSFCIVKKSTDYF
jgi:hypothetical protein